MRQTTFLVAAALATALAAAPNAIARPDKPGKPGKPGKPDNPGKPDRSSFGKARALLVRSHADDGSVRDEDAKGRIDVQRRRNGSDVRIMGQRLDAGLFPVDVVLKRTVAEVEEEETLADDVPDDGEGSVRVMLRTHKGDALPFGVASLDDLAGARVCIRLADNAANGDAPDDVLVGTFPLIGADHPKRLRERADLVPDEGAACTGRVELAFRGKDIRSELSIDVAGLAQDDVVSFRMDDGTGAVTEFATGFADAEGTARFRARSNHGDALPFGAATVLDLRGRAVEVWVNPASVDETDDGLDNPVETGRCLTGAVPGGE